MNDAIQRLISEKTDVITAQSDAAKMQREADSTSVGNRFDQTNAAMLMLKSKTDNLEAMLSTITGTSGDTLQGALQKISQGIISQERPERGIMESKAISNLDKQASDKKNYGLWLE